MTATITAAEAVLDTIDMLLGAIDVDLALDVDCRVDAILSTGIRNATTSIRAGQPGLARFQLEAARLRAQHLLDGCNLPRGAR